MSLLAGYLLRDKTSFLVILENRIHIQQVHSWSGAKAPAGWRCATNFLPTRVITESKVGSDSEPFWNISLLRIRRWNESGTMMLPYGAGGEPGRGECPMSSVMGLSSQRTILGMRTGYTPFRTSAHFCWKDLWLVFTLKKKRNNKDSSGNIQQKIRQKFPAKPKSVVDLLSRLSHSLSLS